MRLRAKKDDNQQEIERVLRQVGCSVADTSSLGSGFPDLVVGRLNNNYLLEVKDGNKPKSKRGLTPDEHRFQLKWRGNYAIVSSVNEALKAVELGKLM